MKGYYMMFRCRLCGKTFTNSGTGDKETAWTATANAMFAASGIEPLKKLEIQPFVHETHCCEDGSFGIADFLGMKWAENGEIVADYLIGSSPCQDLPYKARRGDKK